MKTETVDSDDSIAVAKKKKGKNPWETDSDDQSEPDMDSDSDSEVIPKAQAGKKRGRAFSSDASEPVKPKTKKPMKQGEKLCFA